MVYNSANSLSPVVYNSASSLSPVVYNSANSLSPVVYSANPRARKCKPAAVHSWQLVEERRVDRCVRLSR